MSTSSHPMRLMSIAAVFAVLGFARSARAVDIVDDPIQIDERLAQVVQSTNSLCWEMYRYHQQKPDYPQAYRMAKDLWRQAGALRDGLLNGPMETEFLVQQVAQMKDAFAQLDQSLSKWGDGDRSILALNGTTTRTVVTDGGVTVNLPLLGVQVGGPRVAVVEEDTPNLARRRLHPNSRGSKRSLERELAAAKVAMSYLTEDVGLSGNAAPPSPGPSVPAPVPHPPEEADAKLGAPVKVLPRAK